MEFILYTRVSTESQGISGLGLEAQQRDINLYLTNYADETDTVIAEFQDIASGCKDDRSEYLKAVALAEKTGSTILVSKLDRISRSVATISALIEKIDIKIAVMPFADKFQLHLYAALAQQEREFISLRTKAALQSKRERGESMNNPLNFKRPEVRAKAVQTLSNNKKQANDKLLPIVQRIVSTTSNYREACTILNDQGIKTTRGGKFHPTTISRIMQVG
nr:recombinase family protein [Moritella viscosa]SHO03612.1 Site-specific recombinase, resolvase family protein [Moritella viscosa]